MGCYTQLCDNGLLYYDQYYGVYDYEQYILYRYDKEWNEKFVEGLELYYIDKPEEGVKSKGNGELNMEEAGLYFWNFKIYDGERVYTKLTQEEWNEKFHDLFGRECKSIFLPEGVTTIKYDGYFHFKDYDIEKQEMIQEVTAQETAELSVCEEKVFEKGILYSAEIKNNGKEYFDNSEWGEENRGYLAIGGNPLFYSDPSGHWRVDLAALESELKCGWKIGNYIGGTEHENKELTRYC